MNRIRQTSSVTLTAATRQNLLSLQDTATLTVAGSANATIDIGYGKSTRRRPPPR